MAYNQQLADRVRELIAERTSDVDERLMFGGIAFMVRDKIAVTVRMNRIMVRLAPAAYEAEIAGEGCSPMNHGGREMKGFLFVAGEVLETRSKLKRWVDLALDYNEKAGDGKPKTEKPVSRKPKRRH